MEILDAKLVVVIVGIVGVCEAIKKSGLRWPTAFWSFVLAAICGATYAEAFHTGLTVESAILFTVIFYGGATLAYEGIVKKYNAYKTSHADHENK